QPREHDDLHDRPTRPRWYARPRSERRHGRLSELHQDVAGQLARAVRADGRVRYHQSERLHEIVEADRRRDERLLRAGLLLVESRSNDPEAQGGGEGESTEPRASLPHRVHAEANQGTGTEEAEHDAPEDAERLGIN